MTPSTDVSVIVVNWNSGGALARCLASVFESDGPARVLEVFVVDNASTDGSQTRAVAAFPAVHLIQNRDNVGFARANNQALRLARGAFALLVNPDVVLAPGALGTLADFMAAHPETAVAGPRLLNPDGTRQGSARRDPSAWTGLFGRTGVLTQLFPGNPVSRRELPGLARDDRGSAAAMPPMPPMPPMVVDWVAGGCLMVRRAAYEAVGLMDERFFLFWEDADWCLRFRKAGWTVHHVPAATATHRVGVSRAKRPLRSVWDFHRSAYQLYRKHFLPSPFHPMMLVLVGGLVAHAGVRLCQALLGRR